MDNKIKQIEELAISKLKNLQQLEKDVKSAFFHDIAIDEVFSVQCELNSIYDVLAILKDTSYDIECDYIHSKVLE